MKKLFTVFIACLLLLTACDTNKNPQSVSEADTSNTISENDVSFDENSDEENTVIDRTQTKVLVSEGCSYTAAGTPHGDYPDDGTKLTDGVLGADIGVGWATSVGEFVLDLGENTYGLADFNILMRGDNWGIVAPAKAEYYVSEDGQSWSLAGTVSGDGITKTPADATWVEYSYLLELDKSINGRYVKFVVSEGGMNFAWVHEICVWRYEAKEALESHVFNGTEEITNLTFTNPKDDMMGDQEAPGYCVYSKTGYNKSEFIFELSQAQVSTFGDNGSRITAYVFLGANVYDENGYWQNCCDAGFVYSNENTGWRLFAATATDENGNRGWYDGGKTLDSHSNYRLVLDTSVEDGRAAIYAYDMRDGSLADSITFDFYGVKKDGGNTAFLTDIAIDWTGEQTFVDTKGNPTEDWVEITKANTGHGMYLKNVRLYGCSLYKNEEKQIWTKSLTDHRGIWSDGDSEIDYVTTRIYCITEDMEYIVDLIL